VVAPAERAPAQFGLVEPQVAEAVVRELELVRLPEKIESVPSPHPPARLAAGIPERPA
jgi:hypothetical protein